MKCKICIQAITDNVFYVGKSAILVSRKITAMRSWPMSSFGFHAYKRPCRQYNVYGNNVSWASFRRRDVTQSGKGSFIFVVGWLIDR